MRRFLVLLALAAPGACAQQAALPSAVPQTVNQSVSVIADEPLPLDAPDSIDRTVRRLSAGDDQTQPLYSSPEDLLRLDTSVTLEERGSGGIQADISIRGTTFEQTLVLVDGMRLNDPETGHLNMDLSLPLEAVSRIDILHGAGSTLFGSDAIGGAINLITTAPTRNSAMLELGGGNMGQTEQHFQLSSTGERLATRLTGDRDTSDGFFYEGQNDRGYHSNVLSLDTFISPRKGLQPTEMILGASDRPYGANLFYGHYDSAERTKGWLAAIRQPLPANLQADFAYRKHTDEYILLVQDPALYENNHIDTLWQADLRGSSTAGRHFDLAYGLESDGDAIRSNSLGHHARNQGAGYADLALHALGRLTLSIGGREEVYAGPNSIFTPTVSAGYFLGHGLHAHAAAGRGFRLPTYVDLYYADPATIGNSQLKPETSASYEGGMNWIPHLGNVGTQPRLEVGATGFTLRQTNAIDYSKYVLTEPWQATNVGRIAYSGVEATATLHLTASQQIDLGETFVHAPPAPAGLLSEYAYNYASHNASCAWQGVFARAQLAARTQVSIVQQVTRTAYPLWNVALTRTHGAVRPYVRAVDLANIRYSELVGVPLPGRSIVAGMTLTWPER